ncbi:MAG: tRNA (guanosine(37)-N1)-methyltransferase TrmD [Rhodospirillales bacterium]|nr:tRNA (guanosine(37)-N1)-methyltransferase TrmD [Rhodospirillales bacterium]
MSDAAAAPWMACVLTIFPEMFPGPLAASLAGQALDDGRWRLETMDIRGFARDKHGSVDDAPFGGGPGMVMRPDVVEAAISAAVDRHPALPLLYLTPRGRPFDQARARALAAGPGLIALCGRYEGVDERVMDVCRPEEISLGDFVLSGGEPAALTLIDACVRLLPGVLGDARSLDEESFEHGLLEYPHYTRPRLWQGRAVPDVLLSGHHAQVAAWRRAEAERITRERRPDLWARHSAAGMRSGDRHAGRATPYSAEDEP